MIKINLSMHEEIHFKSKPYSVIDPINYRIFLALIILSG
jgi:hypothetical protein